VAEKNLDCQVIDFLKEAGVTEVAVGATGAAYLLTYPMTKGGSYAFEYQFSSGGTISVAAVLEQGNTVLTAAQEKAAHADFVVPEDAAAFDTAVSDALTHIKAYAPAATGFARLRFTGTGSNAASTKLIKAKMSVIKGA
jgi:hypothetical protein